MSGVRGEQSGQEQVQQMVENLSIEQLEPEEKESEQTQQPSQEQQVQVQGNEEEEEQFEEVEPQAQQSRQPETSFFVNVNRKSVEYSKGVMCPGSIEELDVIVEANQNLLRVAPPGRYFCLRIQARCDIQEFNDLEEYVFSVRNFQRVEYFQELRFKVRSRDRAQVKVAVKVPSVKEPTKVLGTVIIQLENARPLQLPIIVNCEAPQVICLKKLYKVDENTSMIKIPAKKNQIRMPPIPFKNLSSFSFTLEMQAISNENFSKRPYDIIVQNFVNCQPNTQFFVNLQLKENMNYQGPMPTKDTIRKILVLKIKNSTIMFSFPIEIQVFQSSNNSSMG